MDSMRRKFEGVASTYTRFRDVSQKKFIKTRKLRKRRTIAVFCYLFFFFFFFYKKKALLNSLKF
jgi:hypothetical protein